MLVVSKFFPAVVVGALLMGVPDPKLIADARGAGGSPGVPKPMFQAPQGWRPTRISDSVLFYDAPGLKRGEHCRVSVFSRTEVGGFKEWFARVQAKEPVIEESKLLEGKSRGGYATLRMAKVVKLPSGTVEYRVYLALQERKRYALILCTASSEELSKAAGKVAEGLADTWDFSGAFPARVDTGTVVQVRLPAQDITLFYVERKDGFTVKLETKDASIEAQKLYIGDGKVAAELVAHPADGIFLQKVRYRQGDQFKKGSTIRLRAGYRQASDLKSGDVYVTLPGVTFELPTR